MILHKLFLLHVTLKDQDILTWDLFMSRFDTLCLEAQIDLDSTADESSLQGMIYSFVEHKRLLICGAMLAHLSCRDCTVLMMWSKDLIKN
jgi:hypothetical protein